MTHAFEEAFWLHAFLGILKFPVPHPFPILSDNQVACALSHSPAVSAHSKHIDIWHHFIPNHLCPCSKQFFLNYMATNWRYACRYFYKGSSFSHFFSPLQCPWFIHSSFLEFYFIFSCSLSFWWGVDHIVLGQNIFKTQVHVTWLHVHYKFMLCHVCSSVVISHWGCTCAFIYTYYFVADIS